LSTQLLANKRASSVDLLLSWTNITTSKSFIDSLIHGQCVHSPPIAPCSKLAMTLMQSLNPKSIASLPYGGGIHSDASTPRGATDFLLPLSKRDRSTKISKRKHALTTDPEKSARGLPFAAHATSPRGYTNPSWSAMASNMGLKGRSAR
jgi:hypothetical protein